MPSSYLYRRISVAGLTGLALGSALVLGFSGAAQAAIVLDGPIDLKTAAGYAVLAGSTVTNSGPTVVTGDVGLSPGTAIEGFEGEPAGSFVLGTGSARTDPDVDQAKIDLDEAFGVAASLTPQAKGLSQLAGKTLTPGVYSGGALDLASGSTLTLDGGSASVWVFQAASTVVTGSGSRIELINGASICNVFWQVGSSATLGSGSTFVGTIMAQESISVGNAAVVQGRLLASTSEVTLINDTIVRPSGCTEDSGGTTETTTPEITTDSLDDATVGTPYEDTVTTEGTPTPTVTVTEGELPAGLTISDEGVISGTPTTPGTSTFTVTASNGDSGDVTATYTIVTEAAPVVPTPPTAETPTTVEQGAALPPSGSGRSESLAATGLETGGLIAGATALLALGLAIRIRPARRRP